ncbi:PilZ domain-containing protein [Myxococcota bacterium]|nr:PilZ domain-containing protein [Myxococcota bacterium]
MHSIGPAPATAPDRTWHRVETWLRVRVDPAPPQGEGDAPREALTEVARTCYGVLDSLRHLRLELDSADRVVAERIQRFCAAVASAIEDLEARADGEGLPPPSPGDVSGGGLGVACPRAHAVDDRVRVAFRLEETAAPLTFRAAARVASCRRVDAPPGYRLGLEFVDLDEESRERLVALLFEVQRRQRRAER